MLKQPPPPGKALAAKLAWILLWVALGAMGGTVYWKITNRAPAPPPEPTPAPAPVVHNHPYNPPPATPVEPEPDAEWRDPDVDPQGSGDGLGSTVESSGNPENPPGAEEPPAMTTAELDRGLVKKVIYDYYAALSRNEVDVALGLWFNPDKNTENNIRSAVRSYDQIVVDPESLTVTSLDGPEAEVAFSIKAYLPNGKYNQIKKEATIVRKDGKWLIAQTGNPK